MVKTKAIQKELWRACQAGDCGAIRLAVMHGADLDVRDEDGRNAHNIASQYGQIEALKTLTAAKQMTYFAKAGGSAEELFFKKVKAIKKAGTA